MPERDLYEILGVPPQAAPSEIKRAYRRLALAIHPDVGARSDPERFREVHEAYEILSDPERRRSYDIRLGSRPRPSTAEPLRYAAPVTIRHDFLTLRPLIEEMLDHIRQNFCGYRPKSGGPYRRLGVEAILDPEEARFGCQVPFNVPCYVRCPRCDGVDEWWGMCPYCYGAGMVESTRQVLLKLPPGCRDGERYEVDLENIGIDNILLEIRIVVP
jgi:molecular chaperone DnaJ